MYRNLEEFVGNTPLVRLKRVPGATSNTVLAKLEGNNPAGSVKDRPALSMIVRAQERGTIKPGDTLIEPTSGNTGIALAMCAAMMGYRMVLVMPEHLSVERRQSMAAFGAEIVLTSKAGGHFRMPGICDPSVGWQPTICTAGLFSLRKRDTPMMVPVVPMLLTKCVMAPPVSRQISGPVPS